MKHTRLIHVMVLLCLCSFAVVGVLRMGNGTVAAQGPDTTRGEPEASSGRLVVGAPAQPEVSTAAVTYQHVAGTVFVPRYPTTNVAYGGNGCRYVTGTNLYLDFPVTLPNQSHISELKLYFKDTNAASDGVLRLEQFDDGNGLTFLATVTSSGSGGLGSATIATDVTLDYTNYSYLMFWDQIGIADGTLQLCGFRVGYTSPGMFGLGLPIILK